MAFFNEFPHTRTYDSDLAWLIRRMKELLTRMDDVDRLAQELRNLINQLPQNIRDEVLRALLQMINNGDFDQYFQTLMYRPDVLEVTSRITLPNFVNALDEVVFTVFGSLVMVDFQLTWIADMNPSYNGNQFLLTNTNVAKWTKPDGAYVENTNIMQWFNERFTDTAFNNKRYSLSKETDQIISNSVSSNKVEGVGGYVGISSEKTDTNMFRLSLTRFTQSSNRRFHYSGMLVMPRRLT